ncbi:hypothetical protein DY000_02026461 [Brassica cretica]|uniref:FLZ-type domain-containing protein n=1 Tax=Brassica cretica TaxID=69181 RepID=A0ABQ7E8Z2_BRACR|nr:hypothetical protein DY000_02026461 [Brassica cretica]
MHCFQLKSSGDRGVTCSFERAYPDLVVYSPDFSGSQALSSCIPSALGTRRLIMSSYWGRRVRTEREFHSAESGEIRSETLRSWRFSGAGPIGQRCSVVERCYVRCTIAAIDNDMGWYYISCKVCGTKLDMLHNNVHPGGTYELDVRCMLYCSKCKMLNPKLKLRY